MSIGVHPRDYWLWLSVQDVPDPENPEDWVFQLQWTWKTGSETASLAELDLSKLKAEAVESFGEPYRTAWTHIPDGTRLPTNRVSIWTSTKINNSWNGRIALVGDAAHAMSFHRGQDAAGLTEALTDAYTNGKPLKTVSNAYEGEMIKCAGEEVVISKMNTEMMHDWERLLQSLFMHYY